MPNWEKLTKQAHKQWDKLSPEQLESVGGDRSKLSGLLRENYGLADEEATKQVEDFYMRYQHSRNDAA